MGKVLKDLLEQLTLEEIEEGIYRGQSQDLGLGAVFGGQVMGQALSAAKATVLADRTVHSFHSYFLRSGDVSKPIIYDVEKVRDGGSITTRRVCAIQNGEAIFYMTASFQIVRDGYDHQDVMPDVPGPEELMSDQDHILSLRDELPEHIRAKFVCERPIEIRPVHYLNPLNTEILEPVRYVWFKANGQMPDDSRIHKYLLAYASDFCLLPTALQPHGKGFMSENMQVVTIDHSMWFHRDFRLDDWLLYAIDSSSASGSRGLVRGRFFTRDGKMVATTMQEGLIRNREIA